MRRSFSFRCVATCGKTGELIEVLTVFFGRGVIDLSVVDDELQNAIKTRATLPDAVALLSFGEQAENIKTAWESNALVAGGLFQRGHSRRMEYLKELAIWKFSNGDFQKIFRDKNSKCNFDLIFKSILLIGLSQLVDSSGAYQEAPPGHVFKHPSKRETKHFLLASELLKEEVDAYFVALVILVNAWERLRVTTIVHIDTMGIYPIARAIADISIKGGGQEVEWSIQNFHSHQGINNIYKVIEKDEAVLISASTTGGMARGLVGEGIPEDALITILDMSDIDRRGVVVYSREKFHPDKGQSNAQGGEAVIELAGEYFAATGKKPRTLTLTIHHAPEALKSVLRNFSDRETCSLNRQRVDGSTVKDLISICETKVSAHSEFRKWISEELRLKTPISVSHIIHVAGEGAQRMAEHCAAEIESIGGRKVTVLNLSEVSSLASQGCTGIVVCAPVVGDGHTLRTLARDLREVASKASRHFLTGIALPSTRESWKRLSQFLIQSGSKKRPYILSSWLVLPTGIEPTVTATSRADEIMQEIDHLVIDSNSPWSKQVVAESLSILGITLENNEHAFLPTVACKPLALTEGFVYWSPSQEARDASNHAAVSYLAMSSALQHAREFDTPSARLASSLHETVVLDAENFLRFNDGTLQASLLRAALPHELDYSRSPELSEMMREFLEKVFLNCTASYGEAALEFGLALASGHLRLTESDKRRLLEVLSKAQTDTSLLAGLLYIWWKRPF